MDGCLEAQRRAYVQALERDLASVVTQLKAMPAVQRVILFGSYAAGRRDLFTDLDILVVMDSSLGFVERTAELCRQLRFGVDLDLLVYTPDEFVRMSRRSFVRHALATGKVLYARHITE